jgi:hypothetical protein
VRPSAFLNLNDSRQAQNSRGDHAPLSRGNWGIVGFALPPLRDFKVELLRFWSKLQLRYGEPQYLFGGRWCSGGADRGFGLLRIGEYCNVLLEKRRHASFFISGIRGRRGLRSLLNLHRGLRAGSLVRFVPLVAGLDFCDHSSFGISHNVFED